MGKSFIFIIIFSFYFQLGLAYQTYHKLSITTPNTNLLYKLTATYRKLITKFTTMYRIFFCGKPTQSDDNVKTI